MHELVEFTVSYAPVSIIRFLCIIVAISSEGVLIFFDIYNAFQNAILPYPEERFYLSFSYLYLDW